MLCLTSFATASIGHIEFSRTVGNVEQFHVGHDDLRLAMAVSARVLPRAAVKTPFHGKLISLGEVLAGNFCQPPPEHEPCGAAARRSLWSSCR